MNCSICNGIVEDFQDAVDFKSAALGTIRVPRIVYQECSGCGERVFSPEESEKLLSYVRSKEMKAIRGLPISEFISLNTAAEVLGMSKQAFSKNKRIESGFIYHVQIDNRLYYHKRSVELFRSNGRDGRFRISNTPSEIGVGTRLEYSIGVSTGSVVLNSLLPVGEDFEFENIRTID